MSLLDEKKGINAIIKLQKYVGITETPEQAKIGWKSMSPFEKKNTMLAYKALFGDSEE